MCYVAKDYSTGRWVTGEPARVLRLGQVNRRLALLADPQRRAVYGHMTGTAPATVAEFERLLRSEAAELEVL